MFRVLKDLLNRTHRYLVHTWDTPQLSRESLTYHLDSGLVILQDHQWDLATENQVKKILHWDSLRVQGGSKAYNLSFSRGSGHGALALRQPRQRKPRIRAC